MMANAERTFRYRLFETLPSGIENLETEIKKRLPEGLANVQDLFKMRLDLNGGAERTRTAE
jgi:hypothetical protein